MDGTVHWAIDSPFVPGSLSKDSIHPNLDGYKIMEAEILKVLK